MDAAQMQVIFEGGFCLVVTVYMIGFGIGTIVRIIRMASEK